MTIERGGATYKNVENFTAFLDKYCGRLYALANFLDDVEKSFETTDTSDGHGSYELSPFTSLDNKPHVIGFEVKNHFFIDGKEVDANCEEWDYTTHVITF